MAAGLLETQASASRVYMAVKFSTSLLALAYEEKGFVRPVPNKGGLLEPGLARHSPTDI